MPLGCRAVVLYPEPGAKAPRIETPEPNIKICYMPAVAFGVQAFYKSWQILLDEHADAVHVMGDNSLGVPGLYRFCQKHGILFYSQLGALKSTSNPQPVRDFIVNDLHRSATMEQAEGAYTHDEKWVLTTVLTRGQAQKLRLHVRGLDDHAFITIVNSSEIVGKGFRAI